MLGKCGKTYLFFVHVPKAPWKIKLSESNIVKHIKECFLRASQRNQTSMVSILSIFLHDINPKKVWFIGPWWSFFSFPKDWGCGTTSKWQFTPWFINRGDRGDPNHLQVLGWSFKYEMLFPKVKSKALPCQAPPSPYSMQRCWHSAPWKRTKKTKRLCWVWTLCMVMCRIRPHWLFVSCVFDVLISAFPSERLAIQINFQVGPITYDLRFFFEPGDNANIRMWNE